MRLNGGAGPHQRDHRLGSLGHLPGFNADDYRVYFAYLGRFVGDLSRVSYEVSFGAFDPQTAALDSFQVFTSGNHAYLVTGAGQQGPKITTGST